jgi:hypothetical protein
MSPQTDLPAGTGKAGVGPRDDLELPRPWRLILTAGWNLAESLGLLSPDISSARPWADGPPGWWPRLA